MTTTEKQHYCMSIHTCYVDEMRAGNKLIELRKIDPRIEENEWVAVYETLPTGSMGAAFRVGETIEMDPGELWLNYRELLGIEEGAYFQYFKGRSKAYGLCIKEFREFEPIGLQELREGYAFTAPQGVVRLRQRLIPEIRRRLEETA